MLDDADDLPDPLSADFEPLARLRQAVERARIDDEALWAAAVERASAADEAVWAEDEWIFSGAADEAVWAEDERIRREDQALFEQPPHPSERAWVASVLGEAVAARVMPRTARPPRFLPRPREHRPSRRRRVGSNPRRARAPGRSSDDDPHPARRALARLVVVPCAEAVA